MPGQLANPNQYSRIAAALVRTLLHSMVVIVVVVVVVVLTKVNRHNLRLVRKHAILSHSAMSIILGCDVP